MYQYETKLIESFGSVFIEENVSSYSIPDKENENVLKLW